MCVDFEKERSEPTMTFWNISLVMSFRGRDSEVMMNFGQGWAPEPRQKTSVFLFHGQWLYACVGLGMGGGHLSSGDRSGNQWLSHWWRSRVRWTEWTFCQEDQGQRWVWTMESDPLVNPSLIHLTNLLNISCAVGLGTRDSTEKKNCYLLGVYYQGQTNEHNQEHLFPRASVTG